MSKTRGGKEAYKDDDEQSEADLSFQSNLLLFDEDDISLHSEVSSPIFSSVKNQETTLSKKNKAVKFAPSVDSNDKHLPKSLKSNSTSKSNRSSGISSSLSKSHHSSTNINTKNKKPRSKTSEPNKDTSNIISENKKKFVKVETEPDVEVEPEPPTIPISVEVLTDDSDFESDQSDATSRDSVKEYKKQSASEDSDEKGGVQKEKDRKRDDNLMFHDEHITFERKISIVLSKIPCIGKIYNPSQMKTPTIIQASNVEEGISEKSIPPPNLNKGWEFYEHWTLPRCFVNKIANQGDEKNFYSHLKGFIGNRRKYIRADAGEKDHETMLYPLWGTSITDMQDFGVGVGLYFQMLRYFILVTFIAGLLSIPIMVFYSNNYASAQNAVIKSEDHGYSIGSQLSQIINLMNVGTAICTNARWEVCPDCENSNIPTYGNARRVLTANRTFINESGYSQTEKIGFIYKNHCQFDESMAIWNLVVLIFVVVSTLAYMVIHRKHSMSIDDNTKTASDYSILITNPPSDATDPDVWKKFFEDKFDVHVTLCTVVLDNATLVKKIIQRRKLLTALQNYLPLYVEYDEKNLEQMVMRCSEPGIFKRMIGMRGPKEIYDRILQCNEEIEEATNSHFPASKIFLIFETENMQNEVLKHMTYAKSKKVVDKKYKFDGFTLKVKVPDEPSSIRWANLDESPKTLRNQKILTFGITTILIVVAFFSVRAIYFVSITAASIVIVALNVLTPILLRNITAFESHPDETSYDGSIYLKTTLFRWILNGVLIAASTPFAFTLQDGDFLIESIRILFLAELVIKPLLQLWDWFGHVQRHLFAPRAQDQRRLNLFFMGAEGSISERYSDFAKVLFLTCLFSSLYPVAWFFTSIILFVSVWVDKYQLLRLWKQGPRTSAKASSRNIYFLLMCLVTLAVTSSFNMAQFPYDNACPTEESPPNYYLGNYIINMRNIQANFTITNDSPVYTFCNMNMYSYFAFPPVPEALPAWKQWMSDTQIKYVKMYGLAAVAVIIILAVAFVSRILSKSFFKLCCKPTKARIKNATSFSKKMDVAVDGYIPQVKIQGHLFPFLLCDVKNINRELIGWRGIDDNTDMYNAHTIVHDIPIVKSKSGQADPTNQNNVFSVVKHWPPPESMDKKDEIKSHKESSTANPFRAYLKRFFYK